jgi:hypothetical protein
MRNLKQSTAKNIMVFITSSTDSKTGLVGATLTITISKDGGAFGSITPTVTDRGNGWYNLALTSTHTDTVGDLAFHITASGADPTDFLSLVGPVDANALTVNDKTGYALTQTFPANFGSFSLDGTGRVILQPTQTGVTIPNVTNLTNLPVAPVNFLTASAIATSALNGKGDWAPSTTALSTIFWTNTRAAKIDNLDVPVSAVKTKTDNLPDSPAAVGSPMVLSTGAITTAVFAAGATLPVVTSVTNRVSLPLTAPTGYGASISGDVIVDPTSIAAAILADPTNKIVTDSEGRVLSTDRSPARPRPFTISAK